MISISSSVGGRIAIIGDSITELRVEAGRGSVAELCLMQARSMGSGVLLSW